MPTAGIVGLPASALGGDVLALCAAFFWAFYVLTIDLRVGDSARVDMVLLYGFVGLTDLLAGALLGTVLHFTGLEPFELPPDGKVYFVLFVSVSQCTVGGTVLPF
jgi:solute carrier family 35, member F5